MLDSVRPPAIMRARFCPLAASGPDIHRAPDRTGRPESTLTGRTPAFRGLMSLFKGWLRGVLHPFQGCFSPVYHPVPNQTRSLHSPACTCGARIQDDKTNPSHPRRSICPPSSNDKSNPFPLLPTANCLLPTPQPNEPIASIRVNLCPICGNKTNPFPPLCPLCPPCALCQLPPDEL